MIGQIEPGTDAKVDLLAARYEAGEALWQPGDITLFAQGEAWQRSVPIEPLTGPAASHQSPRVSLKQWTLTWLVEGAIETGVRRSPMKIQKWWIDIQTAKMRDI